METLWQYPCVADTRYVTGGWNEALEFGHPMHPDLRLLYHCFPKALFVLNTRSLATYIRAKADWESGSFKTYCREQLAAVSAMQSPREATNLTQAALPAPARRRPGRRPEQSVCSIASDRERMHARVLDFILEDPSERERRFIIADVTSEKKGMVSLRVCRFLQTFLVEQPGNTTGAHGTGGKREKKFKTNEGKSCCKSRTRARGRQRKQALRSV